MECLDRRDHSDILGYLARISLANGVSIRDMFQKKNEKLRLSNSSSFSKGLNIRANSIAMSARLKTRLPESVLDAINEDTKAIYGPLTEEFIKNAPYLIHDNLRWCPECIKNGTHMIYHQSKLYDNCPVHNTTLIKKCKCGFEIPYMISFKDEPGLVCPNCKCQLIENDKVEEILPIILNETETDLPVVSIREGDAVIATTGNSTVFYDRPDIMMFLKKFLYGDITGYDYLVADISDNTPVRKLMSLYQDNNIDRSRIDAYFKDEVYNSYNTDYADVKAYLLLDDCIKVHKKSNYTDGNTFQKNLKGIADRYASGTNAYTLLANMYIEDYIELCKEYYLENPVPLYATRYDKTTPRLEYCVIFWRVEGETRMFVFKHREIYSDSNR